MNETSNYIFAFGLYLLVIIILCLAANRHNRRLSDYLLGGRSLSGPVTALGVGASDMSGWLLLALPGAVFIHGLSQIWMPVGLLIGAYCNWRWIAKRLRTYTEIDHNSLTIPSFLGHRFPKHYQTIHIITAIVVLVFFTVYCAAGFVSGALLFQVAFHINYQTALWVSGLIILFYTMIGGFLAINWIDFFQGSLMFFALLIVPATTFWHLSHTQVLTARLALLPPDYLQPLAHVTTLTILSLLGWGLGYCGQPHILTRFMAIHSIKKLPFARRLCMSWAFLALLGALATGIAGHLYFPNGLVNPTQDFLRLATYLFAPFLTGLLFAAVLSAMMSTVSAQLLASSSALVADIYAPFLRRHASQRELVYVGRICVFICAGIALILASNQRNTLFALVQYAWGGIGASFGPIIIASLFWQRVTSRGALAGIMVGAITVIIWRSLLAPLGGWWGIYEIIPGFILSSAAIVITSLYDNAPSNETIATFQQVKAACQIDH